MMNHSWIIDSPLDMHLHLRQGDMLKTVTPSSAQHFAGAVIMPNLVPPVTSLNMVHEYREAIIAAAGQQAFTPFMTLFFKEYTRAELVAARDHIIGIKLYPEGVTTNSESGISDLKKVDHVFSMMEELQIPLMIHGETHGFVMDREREFLTDYERLAKKYPRLKIIMEHISTKDALTVLDRHENLFATLTLHHLLLTLDDMAGGLLRPHLFCKPILKTPADRDALQYAVLNGHTKIMFGSDSAPHPVHKKEACGCAAGVFSAPVALSMLAEFFDQHNKRPLLQGFISNHARRIHNLHTARKTISLQEIDWQVPDQIGSVVPFMAGTTRHWMAGIAQEK